MMEKRCKYCSKPFKTNRKDKLYCSKDCSKGAYKSWKEKWTKKYQQKEEVKQKKRMNQKRYCEKHPKRIKETRGKYHSSEKGKTAIYLYNRSISRRENSKRYEQTEKGKINKRRYLDSKKGKETKRKYYKTPVYVNNRRHGVRKYRAKKKELIHNFTKLEWGEKIRKTNGFCPECKKYVGVDNFELDHIIPISKATKGFVYTIDGVQPLCKTCNRKKGNILFQGK